MHRVALALFVATALAGCKRSSTQDLETRVDGLEARYHTQARQIKELQDAVAALQGKPPTEPAVIDLVEPPAPQ